jgi:hypothetical protein
VRTASIAAGDIVEIDKKGRRIFGRVTEIGDDGVILFAPLCRGVSHRHARAREVVGHWRRAGSRRSADVAGSAAGPEAAGLDQHGLG